MALMRNANPTCGGTDDCDWGSVSVGIVLPVGASVLSKFALTASQNRAAYWHRLREDY